MREQIMTMNSQLNQKLDRYEIMMHEVKQQPAQTPYQSLIKQIASNEHVIEAQKQEVKKLSDLDKQYEEKDYLVELGELVASTKEQIHNMGKIKHGKWVDVERIDRLLKEIDSI